MFSKRQRISPLMITPPTFCTPNAFTSPAPPPAPPPAPLPAPSLSVLLIRTFLTLEGIAGQVDPNFNIYEVALPWAVQRALSPSTSSARETLRSSLLTDGNTFQWERVEELIKQQQADEAEKKQEARSKAAKDGMPDTGPLPAAASSRARLMAQEANKAELDPALAAAGADAQAAQAATPLESFTTVLGSSNGATLRAIAKDVDSTEMLIKLASPAGRPMRRMAVQAYILNTFSKVPLQCLYIVSVSVLGH